MDEGRLAAVRRRTDHNRKNVIVMNDIIKNRQEVYQNYLTKEQHGVESKIEAGELGLKRNIVRNNILMQCLEARKEKMISHNPTLPLGRYGGRPIHTFSRDIESMIAWMHPRLRRLRKVERMKQNGLRLGAIIDPSTVPARIDAVFGPGGERSNSDSRILTGHQNSSRRKSSVARRRLSRTAGLLDPLTRRQSVNRRPIEAPPIRAFGVSPTDNVTGKNYVKTSVNNSNRHSYVEASPEVQKSRRKHSNLLEASQETDIKSSNAVIPSISIGENSNENPNKQTPERNSSSNNEKLAKRNSSNRSENSFVRSEDENSKKLTRRPTLVLPPIQTSRELVKK